jgi:polyisoprenoid-binding protein YceI
VREIEATIAGTVLQAGSFPEIRFASTAVSRREGGYDLLGSLSLRGVTRPLALPVAHEGDRLVAVATVHQPDFGIRPYRAMMGTLRVKADVVVRVSVPGDAFP